MKALAITLLLTLLPLHASGEPAERIDPAATAIEEEVRELVGVRSDALVQMCGMTVMLISDYDTAYAMIYVGTDMAERMQEVRDRTEAGESLMIVDLADAYPPVRALCPDYHYVNLSRMKAEGAEMMALMAKGMMFSKWNQQHPMDRQSTGVRMLVLEHHKAQMCTGDVDAPQGRGPKIPATYRF